MAASTARKTPTLEQRRKALDLAVGLASAHKDLNYPGPYALEFAEQFADYLANGPKPVDSEESTTN